MRTTDSTRRLPLHVALVLLVVAGLVGMHQLAGGAHRMPMPMPMTAVSTTGTATTPSVDATRPTVAAVPPHLPTPHLPPARRAPAAHPMAHLANGWTSGPVVRVALGATAHPAGHAALCLAVLLGLLGLASSRLSGTVSPRDHAARTPLHHGSAPLGRGPPRLLLAKLCVLRT